MLYNNKIVGFLAGFAMLLIAGCYKDTTVVLDAAEVTKTVSFAADVVPIFNSSCNMSGCHSTGGQAPDLSASNAINSLILGNYIDKSTPANSVLYQWMSGKRSLPMPVSGVNKEYNAIILAWIKQGANNN